MIEIEIAKLLNIKYDLDTDRVFLTMEITDPVWKQKILHERDKFEVKIIRKDEK